MYTFLLWHLLYTVGGNVLKLSGGCAALLGPAALVVTSPVNIGNTYVCMKQTLQKICLTTCDRVYAERDACTDCQIVWQDLQAVAA